MKKEILLQKDLTLHSEKKGQKYKSLEQSRRKSLQSRKKEHQISKL